MFLYQAILFIATRFNKSSVICFLTWTAITTKEGSFCVSESLFDTFLVGYYEMY